MLKQKYFLADVFILSAEKQPIKSSWRKIEWLLLTAPISMELKNNEYQIFKKIKALHIKGKNNVPYPGKIKSYFFRYPIFYQVMLKTYSYIHSKYKA